MSQRLANKGKQAPSPYPKSNILGMFFFSIYILAWYLQVGERKEIFGAIRFELLLGLFLIIWSLFSLLDRWRRHREPSAGLAPWLIAFILCLIVQILFSVNFEVSWFVFVNRILKFSMMGLFIVVFVTSPSRLRFFSGALMLAFLYMCQESFRSALDGSMLWENQGVMRLHGSTSLYFHPNSLAGMATGAIPFAWFLFDAVRSWWGKGLLIVLGICALGCVMYSGSRTSYLGLLVFLFLIFIFSERKMRFLVFIGILLLVSIPKIPSDYKARFATIFTGKEIEGASMDTRKQILEDAWEVFMHRPLGVGVASFPTVRRLMFGRTQDTHNLYLEVATNLGIQGFVVFFTLIFLMIFRLSKIVRSVSSSLRDIMAIESIPKTKEVLPPTMKQHVADLIWIRSVASALLCYVVIRLVLGIFGMDLYEIYWWFSLGLTVSLFRIHYWAVRQTKFLVSQCVPTIS
ncbi:MAG: hypothetical protein KCHDKBKB_01493 [Elusimicrobia bacterium]|nr:hypothetical protein [Elusimicrobiota bacterium]